MDKKRKINIIKEALNVLYVEVNNFSIHTNFPEERLTYIVENIMNLERLLEWLECSTKKEIEKLKGELEVND